MKFFAIILSLYFLALNVVPCSDSDTGNITDASQVIATVDFGGDHNQDCELCPPFCQCQCCHVHTICFDIVVFAPVPEFISQENFAHFDSLGKDITLSLLQPPRS